MAAEGFWSLNPSPFSTQFMPPPPQPPVIQQGQMVPGQARRDNSQAAHLLTEALNAIQQGNVSEAVNLIHEAMSQL